MNALTITVQAIENEPRILDTDLAERLGMAQPLNIRQNIEKNRAELEGYGTVHAVRETFVSGNGAKKETTVFYLNEEQALLVCMLSRTEKAKAVRAEVIRVFTAYRHGLLVPAQTAPAIPNFGNPAEAAFLNRGLFHMSQLRIIDKVSGPDYVSRSLIGRPRNGVLWPT